MGKSLVISIGALCFVPVVSAMSFEPHDLELQLVATDSVCVVDSIDSTSGVLPLKVFLHNTGKSSIWLGLPRQGSHQGLGLPVIGWSILQGDSGAHPLLPPLDTLSNPGSASGVQVMGVMRGKESLELVDWIDVPYGLAPGTYRVVFYFYNIPGIQHNAPTGDYIHRHEYTNTRDQYRCSLRSNEVKIRVVGR